MGDAQRQFHPEYEQLRREYSDFRYYLPDALIEVDLSSLQLLYLNRQAETLFGFSEADVMAGLNGSSLMAPEEFGDALRLLHSYVGESRATGTPYVRQPGQQVYLQRLRKKDGTTFLGETHTSFVLDGAGIPVRMLSIIREVKRP